MRKVRVGWMETWIYDFFHSHRVDLNVNELKQKNLAIKVTLIVVNIQVVRFLWSDKTWILGQVSIFNHKFSISSKT